MKKPNNQITAPEVGLLVGAAAIGRAVFPDLPPSRQKRIVYRLTSEIPDDVPKDERLPVFKLGGVICARPKRLVEFFDRMERKHLSEEAE